MRFRLEKRRLHCLVDSKHSHRLDRLLKFFVLLGSYCGIFSTSTVAFGGAVLVDLSTGRTRQGGIRHWDLGHCGESESVIDQSTLRASASQESSLCLR